MLLSEFGRIDSVRILLGFWWNGIEIMLDVHCHSIACLKGFDWMSIIILLDFYWNSIGCLL